MDDYILRRMLQLNVDNLLHKVFIARFLRISK